MSNRKESAEVLERPLFVGDVGAQASVTVNKKGGSLTAILKKILTDKLSLLGGRVSAATIELGSGQSVLLLGADEDLGQLQVIRRGENAFEVVAADSEDAEVDSVTEAFLALKTAQFERGQLDLSGPLSAEDVEALGAESFEKAERLLKK